MNTYAALIRRLFAAALVIVLLLAAPGSLSGASARGLQAPGDAAILTEKSPDPVVGSGQVFQIVFTFQNTGTTIWQPGTYWLQNKSVPLGANPVQPLSGQVVTGGLSTWTIRVTAPQAYGIYHTVWQIYHSGVGFGPEVFLDVKVAPGWVGGIVMASDAPVVALGRPHIDTQLMAYGAFPQGNTTMYVPMLFRNAWGSYNAAMYIQNVDSSSSADIAIDYIDTDGNLTCTRLVNIPARASRGYWMPSECVPDGWVGGAVITSDRDIVALGRPHIGAEITTYNGFASGSHSVYVPMLFNRAWGSYDAALYIQNTDLDGPAEIVIEYRDLEGNLTCSHADTLAARASRGYWIPYECVPPGWVGGAVITADRAIVAIGRPHIGAQITAYNGFPGGSTNMVVPMLFKTTAEGQESALYIQNVDGGADADVNLDFYDLDGNHTCYYTDTIPSFASHGYWLAYLECLPEDWKGSVRISASTAVVAMGRPHFGAEIFAYNGFASGSQTDFLPMLFRVAFGGTYNAEFYVQNVHSGVATVTMDYYDSNGGLVCSKEEILDPLAALDIAVKDIDLPCP